MELHSTSGAPEDQSAPCWGHQAAAVMQCLSRGLTALLAGTVLSATLLAPGTLSADLGDYVPPEKCLRRRVTTETMLFWTRMFVATHLTGAVWCWAGEGFALTSQWTWTEGAAFLICSFAIALRAWSLKELGPFFSFEVGIRPGHK